MVEITKEERILKLLKGTEGGNTPKQIALYTGINQETVKGILRKLAGEGKARLYKNLRGYYEIVEKEDHGIFDFRFHNCILTTDILGYEQETTTITNNLDSIIKTTLMLCKDSHKATMRISSDFCMDLPSLLIVADNFVYAIKVYTGLDVSRDNILVSTIEFNKDYFNLRLDGPNCITLLSLVAQYKLYNKEQGVREEFKLCVPMPFSVLNQLLTRTNLHSDIMSLMQHYHDEIERIKNCLTNILPKLDLICKYNLKKNGDPYIPDDFPPKILNQEIEEYRRAKPIFEDILDDESGREKGDMEKLQETNLPQT